MYASWHTILLCCADSICCFFRCHRHQRRISEGSIQNEHSTMETLLRRICSYVWQKYISGRCTSTSLSTNSWMREHQYAAKRFRSESQSAHWIDVYVVAHTEKYYLYYVICMYLYIRVLCGIQLPFDKYLRLSCRCARCSENKLNIPFIQQNKWCKCLNWVHDYHSEVRNIRVFFMAFSMVSLTDGKSTISMSLQEMRRIDHKYKWRDADRGHSLVIQLEYIPKQLSR